MEDWDLYAGLLEKNLEALRQRIAFVKSDTCTRLAGPHGRACGPLVVVVDDHGTVLVAVPAHDGADPAELRLQAAAALQ